MNLSANTSILMFENLCTGKAVDQLTAVANTA
jgi:hypothetical protein